MRDVKGTGPYHGRKVCGSMELAGQLKSGVVTAPRRSAHTQLAPDHDMVAVAATGEASHSAWGLRTATPCAFDHFTMLPRRLSCWYISTRRCRNQPFDGQLMQWCNSSSPMVARFAV